MNECMAFSQNARSVINSACKERYFYKWSVVGFDVNEVICDLNRRL